MRCQNVIAVFLILFLCVGIACAADTGKATADKDIKKNETIIDATTETSKEIKKDIGVSVNDKASELVNYKVTKEKDKIRVSKDDTKGHTKTVITLDKATAQAIDVDKDNLFSVSRWIDGQFVSSKIVTLSELTSGTEVVFSETIVNGLTGTRTTTFLNVTSGQTLNIQDSSPDAVTASVSGVVPSYVSGMPTTSVYGYWPLNGTANDYSGNNRNGVASNIVWTNNSARFNGETSNITISSGFSAPSYITTHFRIKSTSSAINWNWIFNGGQEVSTGSYSIVRTAGSDSLQYRYSNGVSASQNFAYPFFTGYNGYPVDITYVADYTTNKTSVYRNGIFINNYTLTTPVKPTTSHITMGMYTGKTYPFYGELSKVYISTSYTPLSGVKQIYAGGSGISFQPEPSYNFTGYDVSSGVAKTLDIDPTITGIEVVNTAGTTLSSVTVKEYFSNDTTVITDSHTSTQQTVNISHSTPATMDSGTLLPYPILDGYDGTANMTSTNPNATISRNATHFTIQTGYIKSGVTYYYLVTIPTVANDFVNVPAVAVIIIGASGAFVGGSFINKWYRKRKGS